MKTCIYCFFSGEDIFFVKKRNMCNVCKNKKHKEYRLKNKEKISGYKKNYREKNVVKISKKRKQYYALNQVKEKENCKKYYDKNRDKLIEKTKEYYNLNKDEISDRTKEYYKIHKEEIKVKLKEYGVKNRDKINQNVKNRMENDLQFKISTILRKRLYTAINRNQKTGSAVENLGCSIEWFVNEWIPSQFQSGMSWDNFGRNKKDDNGCYWEIDHKIPFKDVNILNENEFKIVVHFTNLRPCWHWANIARNFYNDDYIDFSSRVPSYFDKDIKDAKSI